MKIITCRHQGMLKCVRNKALDLKWASFWVPGQKLFGYLASRRSPYFSLVDFKGCRRKVIRYRWLIRSSSLKKLNKPQKSSAGHFVFQPIFQKSTFRTKRKALPWWQPTQFERKARQRTCSSGSSEVSTPHRLSTVCNFEQKQIHPN